MEAQENVVITALLGTNVSDYVATVCVTALLLQMAAGRGLADVYATAILTPVILVFGGIVPKDWFRRDADRLMRVAALPLEVCMHVARYTGLLTGLRRLTRALIRWADPRGTADEAALLPRTRMTRLLQEGAARGGLSQYQRDLMRRILNMSEMRVGNVMTPRSRVAAVAEEIELEDFLRIARMAHFSRLPVYRGSPTHVVGVVNVYDVLSAEEALPIRSYVRPACTLHARDTASAALIRLQQQRETMAIVHDGSGRCVGVLTIKDLVEEIVGELAAW